MYIYIYIFYWIGIMNSFSYYDHCHTCHNAFRFFFWGGDF